MLTPKDMIRLEDEKYPEEDVVDDIDESIRDHFERYEYQVATLDQVIPLRIRNKIAAKYVRCGWKYVYHIAGEEKSSSFTKTYFYFSETPITNYEIDAYYLVQRSEVDANKFAVYYKDSLVNTIDLEGE